MRFRRQTSEYGVGGVIKLPVGSAYRVCVADAGRGRG